MKNTVVKTIILSTDITTFGAEWWRPTSISRINEDLHVNINKQLTNGWVLEIGGTERMRELIAMLVPMPDRMHPGLKVVKIGTSKDETVATSLTSTTSGCGTRGLAIINNDVTKVDKVLNSLLSIFKKYEIDAKYLHYPEPIIIERKFISQLSLNLYVMI